MFCYPKIYLENVTKITLNFLNENNIKGLILDIDNTLINFDKEVLDGAKQWCDNNNRNGIKMCILSNTNKVEKVEKVAKKLDLPYIYFAKKPFKKRIFKGKGIIKSRRKKHCCSRRPNIYRYNWSKQVQNVFNLNKAYR